MHLILDSHLSYLNTKPPYFVLIKIPANLYGEKWSLSPLQSGLIFKNSLSYLTYPTDYP